mmetsp:Transcript_10401/g.22075  ORF Transcript_10401/g.22075 Transcript_10401/m.22075 type:complete len:250 (+) Transcript_10401:66-815(+)
MLYADKRALETNLKVDLLAIREKELNFYVSNCQNIGTQAAMLSGFAFAGLMQPLPPEPEVLRVMFLMSTVSGLGLQLVTVITTTLLSMLAPGLALRGPDGAMHQAVDGMIDEYRLGFYTFILGLLAIHGAAISFVWLAFPVVEASILTTCICISLLMLYKYMRRIFIDFALPAGALDTGKFEGAEAVVAGINSGVSDAGEISTLSALISQEQQLATATALFNYRCSNTQLDAACAPRGPAADSSSTIVE